jgi:hypothetical protein
MSFHRFLSLVVLATCWFTPRILAQSPDSRADKEDSIREQTIYIPYEQLKDVFEREGRGVFLPYEQFQKLWAEAQAAQRKPIDDKPPVDAILVSAENTATIENQVVVVQAELAVELLRTGWQRIPLQLNDAALMSASVDDHPAKILHDPTTGYSVLVQNKELKPASIKLKLEYAKAYDKQPGKNSISIQVPQAPINRWKILIQDSGAQVQVEPMLASSNLENELKPIEKKLEAEEADLEAETDPKATSNQNAAVGTQILAFIGASPTIKIQWVPKAEESSGMSPLAKADIYQRIQIEDGTVRTTLACTYTIERAKLGQLTLIIPKNQKVINVFDPNVRKWTFEKTENQQDAAPKLIVELFEPARTTQNLSIELEAISSPQNEGADRIVPVESIVCSDANRQQGFVEVLIGQGLRAEPTDRNGLMQIDRSELPNLSSRLAPVTVDANALAYRFAGVPYELQLQVKRVLPSIRVDQFTEVILEPDALTIELTSTHHVENAGVFQLEFDLPSDFELAQVAGRSNNQVEAASIDSHRFVDEARRKLLVTLNRKAMGKVGTFIQLRKKMSDPNLSAPTGISTQLAIPIPRSIGAAVEWLEGAIVVNVQRNLRTTPIIKNGVRDSLLTDIRNTWRSDCRERFPTATEVLSLSHSKGPVDLTLEVERRRPYVTVRQLLHSMVEQGSIKSTCTLFTDVRYSSVESIRIDLPESIAKDVRIETSGVRESTISPPPTDLAPGYVAWKLSSERPWLDERAVVLTWTKRLEGFEIGKTIPIDVPRIVPQATDQTWGQIVLNRKDSIDLQTGSDAIGLRPIDPRYDLMQGASHPDAVRAFEFQGDWSLQLVATRYALEQVKSTSIERVLVRAVVTRSNRVAVHAMLRLRNISQRLPVNLPADAEFDSQPLSIDGKSGTLERGGNDQLFIPLAGYDPNQSHLVELKYLVPGDHRQIDLPSFPDAPAAQTVYLAAYLPKERTLLSSNGPWTEEFELVTNRNFKAVPIARRSYADLVQWVRQDVAAAWPTSNDLQSDGLMYLYSAINPEPAPSGSLKLGAMDERWWVAIVIGLLVAIGLVLLRFSFVTKIACVALLSAFLMLSGVFAPTFSSQLFSLPITFGTILMGGLWGTVAIMNKWRRTTANVTDPPDFVTEVNDPRLSENVSGNVSDDAISNEGQSKEGGEHV